MTANQKPALKVVDESAVNEGEETSEFTEVELQAAAEQWAEEVCASDDIKDASADELLELASEVPDMMSELKKRALKIREQLQVEAEAKVKAEAAAKAAARKARVADLLAVGKPKKRPQVEPVDLSQLKRVNSDFTNLAQYLPKDSTNFLVRFANEFKTRAWASRAFMGLRGLLIRTIKDIGLLENDFRTSESHQTVLTAKREWLQPRTDKVKAAAAAAGVDFHADYCEQQKHFASRELSHAINTWLEGNGFSHILDIPEDPGPQAAADAEAAAKKAQKQADERNARKVIAEKLMARLRDQFPKIVEDIAKKMAARLAKKYGHLGQVGRIFHAASVNKAKSMLESGESWDAIQQDQSVRTYRVCADKSEEQLVRAVKYRQEQDEASKADAEKRQAKGYGEVKKIKKDNDGKKKSKKPSKKAARKVAAAKQSS